MPRTLAVGGTGSLKSHKVQVGLLTPAVGTVTPVSLIEVGLPTPAVGGTGSLAVSLTTKGSGGIAHTCSGRHSWEPLVRVLFCQQLLSVQVFWV